MTISTAEFNRMERLTPTGLAERTYEASKAGKMTPGPSGMMIPTPRGRFMKADAPLLDKLAKTALGAHHREQVTEADIADVTAILLADLERRFPAADRVVLARHGFAKPFDRLFVKVRGPRFSNDHRIDLAAEIDLPPGAESFTTLDAGPRQNPVPEAARKFFLGIEALAYLRESYVGFNGITAWPDKFRVTEGRPPMWLEIEAAFPIVGKWLAAERARMERAA